MMMNSVFVAGTLAATLMLNLAGAGATTGTGFSLAEPSQPGPAVSVAVTDSFAPAPRKKSRRPAVRRAPAAGAPSDTEETEEEAAPPPPRRAAPAATRRRPPADEDAESSAASDEEDEEEDRPRPKRQRKRLADDEEEQDDEEEEDAPMASMPSVIPRLLMVGIGGEAIGRNFAFNTATQQKESTFPRLGVTLTAEAYPLMRLQRGFLRRLGAAFAIEQELGSAALLDKASNLSFSYPVSQRRWSFDVRYAILAGERVVIVPAVGLGSDSFHRDARMAVNPSQCTSTYMLAAPMVAAPCLADVQSTYLVAGAHLRIALTEGVSLSLGGAYLRGLTIGRGMGQIGAERTPVMAGYQAELGGNLMITTWLGVRAAIPITHYGYAFSGGTATYSSASETYYGLTVSALLFTH